MQPIWEKKGLTREQYGRKYLALAFPVIFDINDKEYQGDIRYDDLQRQNDSVLASERWRSKDTSSEPPHIRHLLSGKTYMLGQLPLGSVFKMEDGSEHVLEMYTYMPRPSKGSSIEIDNQISTLNNSLIVKNGDLTELGRKEVIFLSHPNKIHFAKPTKSAMMGKPRRPSTIERRSSSPKAALKTPSPSSSSSSSSPSSPSSLYKAKAAERVKRVLSRKRTARTTRRKLGSRARSVSVDKVKVKKSPTRRRSR